LQSATLTYDKNAVREVPEVPVECDDAQRGIDLSSPTPPLVELSYRYSP